MISRTLGQDQHTDWSRGEVESIVADYLQMLMLEMAGQWFNKSEHRRRLQTKLRDRSDSAIEFKHCNISAAMIDLGFPYLRGYQPRSNYQALLGVIAEEQVRNRRQLDELTLAAVQRPAVVPTISDFSKVKSIAPSRQHRVTDALALPGFRATKRDYLEREARNRSLGFAGEDFVVQFERWRLTELGAQRLADRIQHVSATRGDGLGFDVLSFDLDGRERMIEVKTTTFGRETPFFVSRTELARANSATDQFHLYRVFEFRNAPRLFDLPGALEQHCMLDPVSYKASFS